MEIKGKDYFFVLMDELVQWQKHENHEPLEASDIWVMKDYSFDGDYCSVIKVIGFIADTEREVEEFCNRPKRRPDSQMFYEKMTRCFELGSPFETSTSYAFHESCCVITPANSIDIALRTLKEECDTRYPDADIKFQYHNEITSNKGGCYIATAVYGSYDCAEVWTLRRFRDDYLSKRIWGRCFIKAYYHISPKLVDVFGDSKVFTKIFKKPLDKMVERLNRKGIENTYYEDH